MQLKLGKMSTNEIVKWLNTSYSTYRKRIEEYLEELKFYCDYERIYGGVIISKIYMSEYNKKFQKKLHYDILKHILTCPNLITTQNEIAAYTGYSKYAVSKALKYCFGNYESNGLCGSRKRLWAVKTRSLTSGRVYEYRPLTEEEKILMHDIVTKYYNNNDIAAKFFDDEEKEDLVNKVKQDYFEHVLEPLGKTIQAQVIRATEYKFGNKTFICETEEEYYHLLMIELGLEERD